MDFETKTAAISGEARDGFRVANPVQFGWTQGNLDTTRRLAAIEQRVHDIKQRFRDQFERHEEGWVAVEALKLWEKRNVPTLQHPVPRNYDPRDFSYLMTSQARRNVHGRAIQRMTKINTMKTRMQNAVVRNTPDGSPTRLKQPSNDMPRSPKNRNGQ